MTRARGRRRWRRAILAVAVAACASVIVLAPSALRELDTFRVRTVEVHGTRYLDPYDVRMATGIDEASSVFDDPETWVAGVMSLPLVAQATIRRRLPSTIVVRVREVEPVALAGTEMIPVDADARVVALDPAGRDLDLPVLAGVGIEAGRAVGAGVGAALATLVAMQARTPDLADRVSQVEPVGEGLRLLFRDESAEVLLPAGPSATQLDQLRLAYTDLAARGELARVRRIDLRFRDQVVVSFHPSPVS